MSKKLEALVSMDVGSGTVNSPEFNSFYRKATSEIKKLLKDVAEDFKFSKGHFEFTGFFRGKSDGQIFYISIGDLRHSKISTVLLRTAEHYKDWTGGSNHYLPVANFEKEAKYYIESSE